MGACFDAVCVECGAHIGWFGEMKDRLPCPRCGDTLLPEELEAIGAFLKNIQEQSQEETERDLAARSPEDIAVTEEGQRAFTPGMGPIDGAVASPYRKMGATPDKRKHKWFMHGFYWAEHEHHKSMMPGYIPCDGMEGTPDLREKGGA